MAGPEDTAQYKAWIDSRLNLFKDITVRSVRNCDPLPNRWLVLGSDAAPGIEQRLADILEGLPYQIVFHKGQTETDAVREALADLPFPLELRTARLDTDDALAFDYFRRIHWVTLSSEQAKSRVLLTFPGGANYLLNENEFYFSSYPDNPFPALAEWAGSPEDIQTVFFKGHHEIAAHVEVVMHLRSPHPMWASVVHDGNLGNSSLRNLCRLKLAETSSLKRIFGC